MPISKVEVNLVASQAKSLITGAVNSNGSITDEELAVTLEKDTNLKGKFPDAAKLREACGAILTRIKAEPTKLDEVFSAIATEAGEEVKAAEEKAAADKAAADKAAEEKAAATGTGAGAATGTEAAPKTGFGLWGWGSVVVGALAVIGGLFGSEKKGMSILAAIGGILLTLPWLNPLYNWFRNITEAATNPGTTGTEQATEEAKVKVKA